MSATLLGVGGQPAATICALLGGNLSLCMTSSWPFACGITQGSWWPNWKDQVFYGVASPYAPASPTGNWWQPWTWGPLPAPGGCGTCLSVDPPSPSSTKKVVVVVAGRRLAAVSGGQLRDTDARRRVPANYLEGNNDNTATSNAYEYRSPSTTFNDWVVYP
jgi:hypothetical protein